MKNTDLRQCCRYTYNLHKKTSIKEVLNLNPDLFNGSWNTFAFYDEKTTIPDNVFVMEKNWKTDNWVLFSGLVNEMKDYIDKINWDDFGTWYFFLFPSDLPTMAPKMIGRDCFLDNKQRYKAEDYLEMNEEWKFIHEVKPDLFISKQKNGIMIGSLSELNLMDITTN